MDISLKNAAFPDSKFGLSRTRELLRRTGSPDKKLKIVHVAGSNGKGAVCAYVTAILCAAGRRTGTFTSPAVFCREESFCIDGLPAPSREVDEAMAHARECARGMADPPSPFELETCAALWLFVQRGCRYCVLECGLGGLEDATNAVSAKEAAIITSISLEHTAVLGPTIADICRHKAGIIRGCPSLVPADLCPEAAAYFAALGSRRAGEGAEVLSRSEEGQTFRYGGADYFIRMHGDKQVYNACLAIECARLLGVGREATERGLASALLPGRAQIVEAGGRRYILDGAHNPEAFGPLVQLLGGIQGQKSLVYTALSDKDVAACAALTGGLFDEVIAVPAPSSRAMDVKDIAGAFAPYCKKILSAGDIPAAMELASSQTVAVSGSFTHLGEARKWIEKEQWRP